MYTEPEQKKTEETCEQGQCEHCLKTDRLHVVRSCYTDEYGNEYWQVDMALCDRCYNK